MLGSQAEVARHMRALPHGEVSSAIETVRASRARPVVKLAMADRVLAFLSECDVTQHPDDSGIHH